LEKKKKTIILTALVQKTRKRQGDKGREKQHKRGNRVHWSFSPNYKRVGVEENNKGDGQGWGKKKANRHSPYQTRGGGTNVTF